MTVCAVCSAIYQVREPHTCTYEPTTRKEPMTNHTTQREEHRPPRGRGPRSPQAPQDVRLECLRLAAETGMPEGQIQQYADRWADFVLGTTTKETS